MTTCGAASGISSFLFLAPAIRAQIISKSALWKVGTIGMFMASYMCNTNDYYCKIDYDMIIMLSTIYINNNNFSIGVIAANFWIPKKYDFYVRGAVLASAVYKTAVLRKKLVLLWVFGILVYLLRFKVDINTYTYLFLTFLWHIAVTTNLTLCCGEM